ncbi:HAD-IIA family hydrolase [Modestobacter sp. I12A-02662]|uniref:HAD-IIA family hydrolase n=1 Tax=Modestobacter sp. I12A-02662 TaxID=1730496 RepID=UPI0034DF29D0
MSAADVLLAARGWVFDVDGCLMRTSRAGGAGGTAYPGAVELVAALKAAGREVLLCTNASGEPPGQYAAHLRQLGFDVADDEFVTAGSAAADHVHAEHPGARVLVLGGAGITDPMRRLGIELLDVAADGDGARADVVVVGATDGYTAAELDAACQAVDAGAPLYTTVAARWFHGGVGRSVCVSRAMAAAVAWVTGVEPVVTGKPSAALAHRLRARFGTDDGAGLVVVGDSTAELDLARAMGARSLLVLSGAVPESAVAGLQPAPDLVFPDVGAVRDALTPSLTPAAGVPQ